MDTGCCSWWHGLSAHQTGPICEPSIGGDNPGQPWPLARSGQGRSVLRKLHSKWHLGKVLNLFWVVFWYSQSPWLGFSHQSLAAGLSKASTLPLHRPAPPRGHSTHPKAATQEGGVETPLGGLIPQLSCLAATMYCHFRWLKFWRGTSLPVWAIHAACSCLAADVAGFGETPVSKLCLQRRNHRYELCAWELSQNHLGDAVL